jgi:hypothetical protein
MKFAMYTRGSNESAQHISVIEMSTKAQAEAYFAGRKQLTLEQFRNLFVVREIRTTDHKNLLLG